MRTGKTIKLQPKANCGGKRKGCSLVKVKKLVEYPYYNEAA